MTLKLMVVYSCTSYISNTIYMQTSPKFMSLDLQISRMDLSRLDLKSSLELSSELQTCSSNCLLNIYIWMAHKYMKLNITPNSWFIAFLTCTKNYSIHSFPSQVVTVPSFQLLRARIPWSHKWLHMHTVRKSCGFAFTLCQLLSSWFKMPFSAWITAKVSWMVILLPNNYSLNTSARETLFKLQSDLILLKSFNSFSSPSEWNPFWIWPHYLSDLHSVAFPRADTLWSHRPSCYSFNIQDT